MAKVPLVNQEECISCGLCVSDCPAVFRFNDQGKSECYDPNGATEEEIQQGAIDVCPVSCIHWME